MKFIAIDYLLLIVVVSMIDCAPSPALDAGNNKGFVDKLISTFTNNGLSNMNRAIDRLNDYKNNLDKELSNLHAQWEKVAMDAEIEGLINREDRYAAGVRVAKQDHKDLARVIHYELSKAVKLIQVVYEQKIEEWFRVERATPEYLDTLAHVASHPNTSADTRGQVMDELKYLKNDDVMSPEALTHHQHRWLEMLESLAFRQAYYNIMKNSEYSSRRLMHTIDIFTPLPPASRSTSERFYKQLNKMKPRMQLYLNWPQKGFAHSSHRVLQVSHDASEQVSIIKLIETAREDPRSLLPIEQPADGKFRVAFSSKSNQDLSEALKRLQRDIEKAELEREVEFGKNLKSNFDVPRQESTEEDLNLLADLNNEQLTDFTGLKDDQLIDVADPMENILASLNDESKVELEEGTENKSTDVEQLHHNESIDQLDEGHEENASDVDQSHKSESSGQLNGGHEEKSPETDQLHNESTDHSNEDREEQAPDVHKLQ